MKWSRMKARIEARLSLNRKIKRKDLYGSRAERYRRFAKERDLEVQRHKTRENDKLPRRTTLEMAKLLASRGGKHATRALICMENGVKNTGRQWRRLHKRLRREEKRPLVQP